MSSVEQGPASSGWRASVLAAVLCAATVPVGLAADAARGSLSGYAGAGRVLLPIGAWCALLLLAGASVRRVRTSPAATGAFVALVIASAAVALYFSWVVSLVGFPGDFLRWSEGPFVQDILHFRAGQPLYGEPDALASFEYPPLTQLLTYAVASLAGKGTSVAAFRAVQLLWAAASSVIGVLTVRELLAISGRERDSLLDRHPFTATTLAGLLLFLVATNSLTNPFSHNLHNDSLATLVSMAAFWQLASYVRTRSVLALGVLCVLPAAGFLVKQSLVLWAPLSAVAVLFLGGHRAVRRSVAVAAASGALLLLTNALAPLLWGPEWSFWIFGVLAFGRVSLLRSVQHLGAIWVFPAMLGGAALVLIRSTKHRHALVLWLVSAALLCAEVYTSGIAWMLNHMGPGSLLSAVWAVTALFVAWPMVAEKSESGLWGSGVAYARSLALAFVVVLSLWSFGAIREPVAGLPPDANRFRAAIEREVTEVLDQGRRVLLDHGSWIFLPRGISVGDRSSPAGDIGASGLDRFGAFRRRIEDRYYARILVRGYGSREFFYDYFSWPRSSGVAAALNANYRVVRVIPAVEGADNAYFQSVSVLEPREPDSAPPAALPR